MPQENTLKWIEEVLVPRILKNSEFKDAIVTKSEVRAMESMKDNFASDMFEINLQLTHFAKNISVSFLSKLMNEDENVRVLNQSDKQFFNEIHIYSTVVPLISSHVTSSRIKRDFENLFPKCYYTFYNTDRKPETCDDAVVVMDNLKVRGFQLGHRTSLDLKHCILALKRLGVLHACSYFTKERDPKTFMNVIVKPIHETCHFPSNRDLYNKVFRNCQQRVIDALATEVSRDDPGLAKLRQLASRDPADVFTEQVQPQEPRAVLCHGDFLRNNILFRYENGEPVDMKFIDFQMTRYASPTVDISVFIGMCTSHDLRVSHFDELLQAYHSSLVETMASLSGKSKNQLDPCYSFESFIEDFRKHAVYGYLITVEFIPTMLAGEEELSAHVKLYLEEKGSPKFLKAARRLGGDRATRAVVDLAKDLLDRNYL